jgi:hypothetical protein
VTPLSNCFVSQLRPRPPISLEVDDYVAYIPALWTEAWPSSSFWVLRSSFAEGVSAREAGLPRTSDPYETGSLESAAWRTGWDQGESVPGSPSTVSSFVSREAIRSMMVCRATGSRIIANRSRHRFRWSSRSVRPDPAGTGSQRQFRDEFGSGQSRSAIGFASDARRSQRGQHAQPETDPATARLWWHTS